MLFCTKSDTQVKHNHVTDMFFFTFVPFYSGGFAALSQ